MNVFTSLNITIIYQGWRTWDGELSISTVSGMEKYGYITSDTVGRHTYIIDTITRTRLWWSLCEDHVNSFCVGIFHESCKLVLVFMSYYYWLEIDFNDLCVQFERVTCETVILLPIVMLQCVSLAMLLPIVMS